MEDGLEVWEVSGNWVKWLEGAKEIILRSRRSGMTGSRCEVCLCVWWYGGSKS